MNRHIENVLRSAEGRYLTKAEAGQLRETAKQVDARLKASEEIEAKEKVLIESSMKIIMRAYPDFVQRYPEGEGRGLRDMSLVLRYATIAMVRNDLVYLDEALLHWFQTILRGVGLTAAFIQDTYTTLAKRMQEELSPESAALIVPYIQHVEATLTAKRSAA